MSTEMLWPIACLVAGLLLLVAEVFIPSGGVIGFLSIGLLGVSLWLAFQVSTGTGAVFLMLLVLGLPVVVTLAIRLWPHTPFGRWLFLKPPTPEEIEPESTGPRLAYLVGQFGRTLTVLRPSGLVDFDGRRLDGLSEEGLIPKGALVRAVQVRGSQIIVREASAVPAGEAVPLPDFDPEDLT